MTLIEGTHNNTSTQQMQHLQHGIRIDTHPNSTFLTDFIFNALNLSKNFTLKFTVLQYFSSKDGSL